MILIRTYSFSPAHFASYSEERICASPRGWTETASKRLTVVRQDIESVFERVSASYGCSIRIFVQTWRPRGVVVSRGVPNHVLDT